LFILYSFLLSFFITSLIFFHYFDRDRDLAGASDRPRQGRGSLDLRQLV